MTIRGVWSRERDKGQEKGEDQPKASRSAAGPGAKKKKRRRRGEQPAARETGVD